MLASLLLYFFSHFGNEYFSLMQLIPRFPWAGSWIVDTAEPDLIDYIQLYKRNTMKRGMFSIRLTNVGTLSLVAERRAFAMDCMGAMAHPSANSPGDRALLRPLLNCQKLSPSLDDALLALEGVVFAD